MCRPTWIGNHFPSLGSARSCAELHFCLTCVPTSPQYHDSSDGHKWEVYPNRPVKSIGLL